MLKGIFMWGLEIPSPMFMQKLPLSVDCVGYSGHSELDVLAIVATQSLGCAYKTGHPEGTIEPIAVVYRACTAIQCVADLYSILQA